MALAEEIAIKLGVKTGDLKSALSDAGASIKKFKKEGEDGGGAFAKSLKNVNNVVGALGAALAGAGVAGILMKFTDAAVKFAENYKGAFDENVAATLRLKNEQSDLRSVLEKVTGQIGVALVGSMEKVGIAIGGLIFGTDAASDALMKMEKESRKAFDDERVKKVKEETAKLTKQIHDNALEQADANGKINILAADYVKLLQEQNALTKGTVEYIKKQTEAEAKRGELAKADAELRKKEDEDAMNRRKAASEESARNWDKLSELLDKEHEAKLENMTLSQRQNVLLKEEAKINEELADLEEGSAEYNEAFNRLLTVRAGLKKTENDAGKTNIEIAKLLLIPEEKRTDIEKEQLKLLTGQTTEHDQQLELARLLNAGVENLSDADRRRLFVLTGQTAELKEQTAELEKQAAIHVGVEQKGDVRTLSNVKLDQVIIDLNKQISSIKATMGNQPLGYTPPELVILQNALDNAKKEEATRIEFNRTQKFFTPDYVERHYAPDDLARLQQLFNPDQQKKDSNNIAVLATGLQNLMPEKFAGAIR